MIRFFFRLEICLNFFALDGSVWDDRRYFGMVGAAIGKTDGGSQSVSPYGVMPQETTNYDSSFVVE